ncbi:MAG: extracellular solute-binding protein, partial [Clostridia bacterium]|nr:extracellular solute-binding protein [Clostridia bacterium]
GFAGCKDSGLKLTVWGPKAQQETLKQMVAAFEAANPDTKYNITIGVCGENDALAEVKKAASSAADVYAYSNDQIASLVSNGLAEVNSESVFYQSIVADNTADSVEAATFNGKLYGYPYASDNGCFMYYNKSILNEEDVKTLEGVIAKCESAGKKIGWALDDSWYAAGFFFAFGCSYEVIYDSDGKESSISCDFDSEGGIKASKAMAKLANSSAFAGKGTGDDTI